MRRPSPAPPWSPRTDRLVYRGDHLRRAQADGRTYICESSHVLFQAPTAREAYLKAMEWGRSYAAEPPHDAVARCVRPTSITAERIGDGVEIGGRLFRKRDVWDRRDRLIPHQTS